MGPGGVTPPQATRARRGQVLST